jgi:hypothetical protein
MLYIKTVRSPDGILLAASVTEYSRYAETRNDWKTFDKAAEVADVLGTEYIATDAGPNVSPRYDVIKLPKVGDKVSKAFNGDSYPCGVIVKISKTLKAITTDGGDVFYRVRQTGSWRNQGTWSLVPGHVSKLNPSF